MNNKTIFSTCMEIFKKTLPCPLALFYSDGIFLGCTHPELAFHSIQIMRQCLLVPNAYKKATAISHNAIYSHIQSNNEDYIVLLLNETNDTTLLPQIKTIINLYLNNQELQSRFSLTSDNKVSFLYQLLYSENRQEDLLKTRASQLGYELSYSRVAIQFEIDLSTDSDNLISTNFSTGDGQRLFKNILNNTQGYSPYDIGDFLNPTTFVLLKAITLNNKTYWVETVKEYIDNVLSAASIQTEQNLRVTVGSPYDSLIDMHHSFKEAVFLSNYFDLLKTDNDKHALFICNHIYDYLLSLLPKDYLKTKFDSLQKSLSEQSAIKHTLIELSKNNINLKQTANNLNLHRNTLLQRYEKIKNQLDLDPQNNSLDRIKVRQFSILCRNKRVINVGVMIQNNNVLNVLYRKLSEQIHRHSDGEMMLEIHTLGISGNNKLLFDYLQQGELDIAIGNTDALVPIIGKQISVLNAPFLFDSAKQGLSLLNSNVVDFLLPGLREANFCNLAFWSMGWRYISYPDTINFSLPSDLKGRRIRIMDKPLISDFFQYLGGLPMVISYDKIFSALKDNIIEMQENPYRNFYELNFHLYQQNILELNMLFDSNILMTTPKFLDSLNTKEKHILQNSISDTTKWNIDFFTQITTNCKPNICEKGVQIHTLCNEEEALWRKAASDYLLQSEYAESYSKICLQKNLHS